MTGRLATKPIRATLAAGALLGLAGCAVMQIDVDVYKGPLANHEDVQVQQFAAMAIGAKPLLEHLQKNLRRQGQNDQGHRVCDVLSLYEDAEITALLRPYLRETTKFLRKYEAEMEVLEPTKEDAAERWRIIESGLLLTSLNPDKRLTPEEERKIRTHFNLSARSDAQSVAKRWKRFVQEYKELLYRESVKDPLLRGTEGLPVAYKELQSKLTEPGAVTDTGLLSKLLVGDFQDKSKEVGGKIKLSPRRGSNSDYLHLSNKDVVKVHADLLFDDSASPAARMFVNGVVETARAFSRSRTLIRKHWLLSLETLRQAQFWDKPDSRSVLRPIETKQRIALTRHLARFIASLTSPKYLAIALSKPNAPQEYDLLNEAFRKYAEEHDVGRFDVTAKSIEGLLTESPTETARQLALVDETFVGDTPQNIMNYAKPSSKDDREEYQFTDKRKYGVARGPVFKDDELDILLQEQARAAVANISGAFAGGRLNQGIETLIKSFVELSAQPKTDKKTLRESRNRLLDVLVRFSEKVLVIANNEILLSGEYASKKSEKDRPQNTGTGTSSKKTDTPSEDCAFVDGDPSLQKAGIQGWAWPEGKDRLNRYVLVLQAVGNSILIQGNELRHRETHDEKLKKRTGAEVQALKRVLERPPEGIIDDVLAGLEADVTRTGERLVAEEAAVVRTAAASLKALAALNAAKSERNTAQAAVNTAESDLAQAKMDVAPIQAAFEVLTGPYGDQISAAARTASPLDVTHMATKIAAKLTEILANVDVAVADQAEPARLTSAKTYFGTKTGDTASDFSEIRSIVDKDKQLADQKIAGLEKAHEAKQDALKKKETASQRATRAHEQADKAATDAAVRAAMTRKLIPKLEHAVAMVEKHRDDVLKSIRRSNVMFRPSEVYARVIEVLEDARDKAKEPAKESTTSASNSGSTGTGGMAGTQPPPESGNTTADNTAGAGSGKEKPKEPPTESDKLDDAIAVLEDRGPPNDPLLFDGIWFAEKDGGWDPKHPNARDVLDTLIAALRHEHIEAVRDAGPDRGRAPRIAAALKVAYEQRAGMAYIRPSAAYLRSSYPSTSLQDDPGLAWRNMLGSHALRSVPFLGQGFANPLSEAEKRKIVKEIDKQFWQTINRVRVAGAGDTNYAIAKDDIGNWYVKAFSANPEKIIKSAQKLALFNIGAQLDTNLLSRLEAEDGEAPKDVSKPALQRLFEEFQKDYAEKTKEDFDGLKASILGAGLETRIAAAWSGIKDVEPYFKRSEIESDLTSTFGALEQTEFTETTAADQSKKILVTADAILRFHGALARTIRERQLTIDPTVKLKQNEKTLSDRNAVLKAEEEELSQKKAERDAANDIVQEKLRADQLDREGFDEAQKNLEEKEAAVQKQEGEVNTAREAVRLAVAAVAKAQEDLQKVEHAERAALAALSREVREDLSKLAVSRNQTVKTFETGVLFIGKATKPADKAEAKPSPAPASGASIVSRGG